MALVDLGYVIGPQGATGATGATGPQGPQGDSGNCIWTANAAATTPDYTFNISDLSGPSGFTPKVGDIIVRSYYRYTIISVASSTVLAGSRTSIRGAQGATGPQGPTGEWSGASVLIYTDGASITTQDTPIT